MNFINEGIGELVIKKLSEAVAVEMAVAFINPSDILLSTLRGVPSLKLVVSEEFAVNDPYKLEQLAAADLRSVPTDHESGKLHAKVITVRLKDGSSWVLLGSANFTHPGMFSNQEVCVELDSSRPEDRSAILSAQAWFRGLFADARIPNLAAAKKIFDERSRYRLTPRPQPEAVEYWALKTTSGGPSEEEHWPMMLSEGVVAIGWEELSVDSDRVSDQRLHAALKRDFGYKKRQVEFSAGTIRTFERLKEGTIILLCCGYTANQKKPVHIYGFGRVTGPFRCEPSNGSEWRFKHDAVIQEVNSSIPRDIIAALLGKDSLRQTMHKLRETGVRAVADHLGVRIDV